MQDSLDRARELAHGVRFRGELQAERPVNLLRPETQIRMGRRLGLEVSSAITPSIFAVVSSVCSRLALDERLVRGFVHSSADLQARCSIADGRCIVEISSALVEHLDEREQAFVIGHEIGHFLLDHHYLPLPPDNSLERYALLRAREVSADRIGLVSCGSSESAMRAIIKTFSGLSESHLRFDAAAFLRSSFDDDSRAHMQSGLTDTHPSFAVRARCLVHFSSVASFDRSQSWQIEFDRMEQRVHRDFAALSEGLATRQIAQLEKDMEHWIWISPLVAAGTIAKDQMAAIEEKFGSDFAQRIRANFSSMSRKDVSTLVDSNLRNAVVALQNATPCAAKRRGAEMAAECETALALPPGSHSCMKLFA